METENTNIPAQEEEIILAPRVESSSDYHSSMLKMMELTKNPKEGVMTDNEINIHEVTSIEAGETEITMVLGDKLILEPTPVPPSGNIPHLVWETSDPYTIFLVPGTLFDGTIEALGVGEATVTATNPNDNSQFVIWNITVVDEARKDGEEGGEGHKEEPKEEPETPVTPEKEDNTEE